MSNEHAKGQLNVSWNNPGTWTRDPETGQQYSVLKMPHEEERGAMQIAVIKYEPNTIIDTHYHDTDYCSIVVEGTIEITRRQHPVGSIRLVKAGTAYGPLHVGPDGCTVVDIFATGTPDPTKDPRHKYVRPR